MSTRFKIDYNLIANMLESIRTTQQDGTPAFIINDGRSDYTTLLSILDTFENFDLEISAFQRQEIIRKAVSAAVRLGPLTSQSLMKEISRQKTLYKKKQKTVYILACSLSIKCPASLHRMSFDHASFTFSDKLPSNYERNRVKIVKQNRVEIINQLEANREITAGFASLRIRVLARSEYDAYDAAINSVDYLRGIWNFVLNRNTSKRWYSGPAKPINSIFLGPIHTLHLPNGRSASTIYWYEPAHPSHVKAMEINDWNQVQKNTAKIRNIIARHPYPSFLREVFIRYSRSLDGIDHETSFLKFWSLLEQLTAIDEKQNYGEVIKRAIFLFENENYHRSILEHLRIRRNASVHNGMAISSAEDCIFQIKEYVEWMIWTHLKTTGQYEKPENLGSMLGSSSVENEVRTKISQLRDQIKLLERAEEILAQKNKKT